MSTMDEIKKKVDDLLKRTDVANKKKAGYAGQLAAKKEELAALIKEIKAAGYDPKNLAAERDKAQANLESMISAYERDLSAVETALTAYDKK